MAYFGEKLRKMRIEHGMSQSELATQLGMTKSRINMYERGEREPRFDVAAQIAAYFNVDINEMLGIPRTVHVDRTRSDESASAVSDELTPDERALLAAYRAMPEDGKNYMQQVLALAQRLSGK